MNSGTLGLEGTTTKNHYGRHAPFQQQSSLLGASSENGSSTSLGRVNSGMSNLSMENSNTISSRNETPNTKSVEKARNNLPVKYKISWTSSSNAFTITLLVPKHGPAHRQDGKVKAKSPFQLADDGANSPSGRETHVLRVPLPYLIKLSNQSSSSNFVQSAPWLDRSTLRSRLSDGGKAVGLESSQIFQSIAAVEESATRIAEWSPANTESVDVNVHLAEGAVSLVAKVSPKNNIYQNHSQSSLNFNYNVLNESSGTLLATAPSFSSSAPDAQFQSSAPENLTESSMTRSFSAFSSGSGNNEGPFGSPKGSLSSYDPWSKSGGGESRMNFAQDQSRNQGQGHQGQAQKSIQLGGGADSYNPKNDFPLPSSPVLNLVSNDHPVSANQLFPSKLNAMNMIRSGSRDSHPGTMMRSMENRPDPSIILEPLLSMGFTRAECEAAIIAIRNVGINDDVHSNLDDLGQDYTRQRSQSTSSIHSGLGLQQEHSVSQPQSRHQRHVSGEDILGYVLSSGSGVSAFEQNMAQAVAADNFQATGQSKSLDSNITFSQGSNASIHSDQLSNSEDYKDTNSWTSVDSPEQPQSNGPVWGNAGKLKVVKSSNASNGNSGPSYSNQMNPVANAAPVESTTVSPTNWNSNSSVGAAQASKLVKVLDIPPELNAFVFHCNAQTREECLERGLFGCPSGGQYGPHSKAKKGDLLFLADFSAWTVSGIFTAKTDAGLNIDKDAWNGRFPWQIRVGAWTELRTVHIDKVNEIIGLASGSKLNMLTKSQLVQLVTSKEFGPCVPPHLFRIKSVTQPSGSGPINGTLGALSGPQQELNEKAKYSDLKAPKQPTSHPGKVDSVLGMHGIKFNKPPSTPSITDEHPATAMHRLKLVTSWFDTMASELLAMNEIFNRKKQPPKKEVTKDALDEGVLGTLNSCAGHNWPLLTYSHVRRAVADIFDQWLLFTHATSRKKPKAGNENGDKLGSSNWTRQQTRSSSSHGKIKEDVVLLQRIPGAGSLVQDLFQSNSGTSAMSVPPKIAELLAIKFINEVEQISGEVRKTQLSLMKIGGDNYMKSIEDRSLGMKISETAFNERNIVKIEWHTKSSIAQGRPPQVQKLYKTHFDVLVKSYRNQASSEDQEMVHFLTRIFVLLCRYDLIGDFKNKCQTIIPPMAQKAMSSQFGIGHDCFASPLDAGRSSFNSSLFADTCKFFGSLGSFFDFIPVSGSFFANPPFNGATLKPMFDHVFRLLQHSDSDRSALSFLIAIRGSEPVLNNVKRSHFCRRILAFENSSKYDVNTHYKDSCSASRKQPKGTIDDSVLDCSGAWSSCTSPVLIWLQNDFGYDLWTPSDEKVGDVINGFMGEELSNNADIHA